jgi:ABC-type phosphate transport system auxiliary subunit
MANKIKLAYTIIEVYEDNKNLWSNYPITKELRVFGSRVQSVINEYDQIKKIITQDPSVLSYALEVGKLPVRKNVVFKGKLPDEVELYYKLTE